MDKRVTALIEYILQDMDLGYDRKSGYFHCSNPISAKNGKKDRTYSGQWSTAHGGLTIWNGDCINGRTHASLKEVISYLGYEDKYQEIMGMKHFHINTFYSENKVKRKEVIDKDPPKEAEVSSYMYKECVEYLDSRKIGILEGLIEPACVEFQGKYGSFKKPYIAMRYPNGFVKFRNIHSKSKQNRFISFGADGYQRFFEVRRNNTDKVYICEGEFDGVSISKYIEDDVMAAHNLNSIPSKITYDYKEVIVVIDHGKFNEVVNYSRDTKYDYICGFYEKLKKCFPNANISIRPKLSIWYDGKWDYEYKSEFDFNDFDVQGKLTRKIVETGILCKDDIDCWKYRDKYKACGYNVDRMIAKFDFLRNKT